MGCSANTTPELLTSLRKCFENVPNSENIKKIFDVATTLFPQVPDLCKSVSNVVSKLQLLQFDNVEEVRQLIVELVDKNDIKQVYEFMHGTITSINFSVGHASLMRVAT